MNSSKTVIQITVQNSQGKKMAARYDVYKIMIKYWHVITLKKFGKIITRSLTDYIMADFP